MGTTSVVVRMTIACAVALSVIGIAAPAGAAESPKPRKSACTADPADYACLRTDSRKEVAGEAVTFRGSLSKQAQKNLAQWTDGENTICLTRYKTTPEEDGSWPWQTLDEACTTLPTDGTFGLVAYLGRQGKFFYGVEMGPCKGDAGLCGNADGGLLSALGNKKNRAAAVKTIAP